MSFAGELKNDSIDIWNNILDHMFIQEISSDTLPKEKFIAYLLQDRIFLKEFCILLDKSMRMTLDKNIKKWFKELIRDITKIEMKMQDELLELLRYTDYDTTVASLPNETTLDYIYATRKLSTEPIKLYELISFIAPCPWTYYEIADKISKENRIKDIVTKRWIEFYCSDESKQQVDHITRMLNDISKDLTQNEKSVMKRYFKMACRNELDFWNMAHNTKLTRIS
ncbi:MAG: hypothetical protein L0H53_13000 [Candidatus Nitrosocosmicus sp.]|nr:hypothetical protein [Candidatus Nitrosocosmicus sp.]